jgi:intein-encoded DNA endonuclease-like protein
VQVRAGVKLRPTTEREKLYQLVLELRKEGLSYNKIIRKIQADKGITLRKSHISGWVTGKHRPYGYVRAFDGVPSSELAYVIGVRLGDASMSISRSYNYKIKLRVIDKEFAQEFSRCLSVILGRSPPRVKWREKTHSWHTEVSSMLLQSFLKRPLEELKEIIEHCKGCVSAFLRGFFDSEGWVYEFQVGVANTNKAVLLYVLFLLETKFGVRILGPRVTSKGGRMVIIKGKLYRANKDCYALYVDRRFLASYQSYIGFTIIRKQQRLAAAVARLP